MLLMALMEFIDFGTCIIYLRERLSLFSGGMICNLINKNPGSPFLSFMCRSVFGVWKSPNECPCSGVPHLTLRDGHSGYWSLLSLFFSGPYYSFGLHS